MKTTDLDYELPPHLIAQSPCAERDASRLLVVDRAAGTVQEDVYANVPAYLRRGDCLVLNNTKVIRARLRGHKPTGGQVEIFLLREELPGTWIALVRPSSKVKPGTPVVLAHGHHVLVEDVLSDGRRRVSFSHPDLPRLLEEAGEIPLPPYIHREGSDAGDARRYQTVYAAQPGAVAAPTAGLHLTDSVFQRLDAAGVNRAFLTLHVGYGTFKPITTDTLETHTVDAEDFDFPGETAARLNQTRAEGGRVVAVGTTSARVLETQCRAGKFFPGEGSTRTYLFPPYTFQGVDVLQTNFHLPKSSLLALVCAFAGRDLVMEAYRYAVQHEFRFYSYGDAMLIS